MNITTNLGKLQCLRTPVRKSYVSESEEVAPDAEGEAKFWRLVVDETIAGGDSTS
jgi:hypothetical protein